MTRLATAIFSVAVVHGGDPNRCQELRENYDRWLDGIAASEHSHALEILPALAFDEIDDDGWFVLWKFAEIPGDGPGQAVERALAVLNLATPVLNGNHDLEVIVRRSA